MAYFEMSRLALKWAFKRPPTTRYPFEPRRLLPGSRGRLVLQKQACVYCAVCVRKCPTRAIAVDRHLKRWGVDRLRCIACGYCVEVCPKDALFLAPAHAGPCVTKDFDYC